MITLIYRILDDRRYKIIPLKQIFDERGKVMHMMTDSDIFTQFGEIYFSVTYPGVVKAWHLHKK